MIAASEGCPPESEDYITVPLDAYRIVCPRCSKRSELMLVRGQYTDGYKWMSAHDKECPNPKQGDSFV